MPARLAAAYPAGQARQDFFRTDVGALEDEYWYYIQCSVEFGLIRVKGGSWADAALEKLVFGSN